MWIIKDAMSDKIYKYGYNYNHEYRWQLPIIDLL